jgi:purine catabolism regulator
VADGPDLSRYVDVELGPLIAHDRTQVSALVPTLRAFLAEHGSKTAAAKRLHVERRTVYYRLERIGTLLARDLDDTETRLRLEVAFRGLDLINSRDLRRS